jgi:hypothetical protein
MRTTTSELSWSEIGKSLGISGEQARQDFISAQVKIRARFPDLIDQLAASLRVADLRSISLQAIDEAPFSTGLSNCDWGM